MKDGLAALLTRRTEQARYNAQDAIAKWQKANEAVAQAERIADYKIALPDDLTQLVPNLAATARTADYVSALQITDDMKLKRRQVIATAMTCLEREIQLRREQAQTANSSLEDVKTYYDAKITASYAKRQEAQYNILHSKPVLPAKPKPEHSAILGGTIIFCIWALCYLLILLLPITRHYHLEVVFSNVFAYASIEIPIVMLLRYCFHAFTCYRLQSQADVKARINADTLVKEAENVLNQADEEYRRTLPICREKLLRADQRVQHAEEAMQWLKAQP